VPESVELVKDIPVGKVPVRAKLKGPVPHVVVNV
jgi:hypothetical protein